MKGGVLAFFAGIAAALALAAYKSRSLAPLAAAGLKTLDLNNAPVEAFAAIGLDQTLAERIVENRPYRNKLELLERFVLDSTIYNLLKDRFSTDEAHAHDGVRVAS
jgi:hypothetical protein